LARLIVEFSPTDSPEDGGQLFVQTNPLKQVHIVDTSVSKLSTTEGLVLLHLLSGTDGDIVTVVLCGDGTKDEDHGESCNPLSLECEPELRLDGPDESARFTPLNNFFILHHTCNNNTQQKIPSALGVSVSVSRTGGRKQRVV
jgi:hypothetical protein